MSPTQLGVLVRAYLLETAALMPAAAAGLQDPRALTFIPSVIVEYPAFWARLLA